MPPAPAMFWHWLSPGSVADGHLFNVVGGRRPTWMFLARSSPSLPPQGMSSEPKFPLEDPASQESTPSPTCSGRASVRADHLSALPAGVVPTLLCTRMYQTSLYDATAFGTVNVIELFVCAVIVAILGALWSELKMPT